MNAISANSTFLCLFLIIVNYSLVGAPINHFLVKCTSQDIETMEYLFLVNYSEDEQDLTEIYSTIRICVGLVASA